MSWTEIMIAIKKGIVASAESVANIVSGTTKVGNADKLDGQDSSYFAAAANVANTYATKASLSGYVTTTGLAAKATADANGNNIVNTYATKAALAGYVTTSGTAARATADASGNNIVNTYKRKSESVNVIVSATAPSDTTAVWIIPS